MSRPVDPLSAFAVWEGQVLGPDLELDPGFYGEGIRVPKIHCHLAHGHVTSSGRQDRQGVVHPAVYLRLALGVIGTGPKYHIVDVLVDADVARDLAIGLAGASTRSALDIEAGQQD
ncbi:MAG: hypothetical protein GY906_10370 [bacterium]|nr:hypothetical protein [bacterium]